MTSTSCGRLPARAAMLTMTALGTLALGACDDPLKASEQSAVDELARIAPVVKEDVEQVRRGLPIGAAKLGAVLDADALGDLVGLQRSIANARAQVPDLDIAKSTFFAFADSTGVVLRSETDPDLLVGKSVVQAFPALKAALAPASGNVEAFGTMPELRGVKTGADAAWVAGHPVKTATGAALGLFVTGWSFRRFAYHLDETARRHVIEVAKQRNKKSVSIVYVFVIKGAIAYGSPGVPDVNTKAIEGLGLVSQTASGPFRTNLDITGRGFGVAAQRAPELGDDAAVAVLLSET